MIENYEIEHLADGATRIQEKFIAPMDMSLLLQATLFFLNSAPTPHQIALPIWLWLRATV